MNTAVLDAKTVLNFTASVVPSVLRHCCLGDRKGIRPVKTSAILRVSGNCPLKQRLNVLNDNLLSGVRRSLKRWMRS